MEIHVIPVEWSSHREALRWVREQVFINEQQVPRDLEWDGQDEASSHFLAINEAGQPVGCARLLPGGQIGRMAVLEPLRGTGLGLRLLQEAIDAAKHQGLRKVFLHAQTHAAGFYRKAGFLPVGGEFMEAGIPHLAMELELPIPFDPPGVTERPLVRDQPANGPEPEPRLRSYAGELDCVRGLMQGLQRARRRMSVFSQQLDHAIFDRPEVVQALSRFARTSAQVQVRILIGDPTLIVSRGHRLVELARRLDSRIEIRRLPDSLEAGDASYVTWDDRGYLLMPDFRDYQAVANLYDPVQAHRLAEQFAHRWERSAADPELRTLLL